MNFKGKTALIAGDAWGLGHATALMFVREGAEVICIDDNVGMKGARTLRIEEVEVPYFHADVSDAAQVQAVDWLELHAQGQRRARFDATGSAWITP